MDNFGVGDNLAKPERVRVGGGLLNTPSGYLENIIKIAVGGTHVLALDKDGTVWTWGLNSSGQLGQGDTVLRNLPTKMRYLGTIIENIDDIATTASGSVVKDASGRLYAVRKY
jgi:alpha-tubulin suppressor-like RCC1 family protein